MADAEKVIRRINGYSKMVQMAVGAITELLEVVEKSRGEDVTEDQIDAEIARIDAEVESATEKDLRIFRRG